MGELVGAIVVATGFLALVVRDALVVHAHVVRELESRDAQSAADASGIDEVRDGASSREV